MTALGAANNPSKQYLVGGPPINVAFGNLGFNPTATALDVMLTTDTNPPVGGTATLDITLYYYVGILPG